MNTVPPPCASAGSGYSPTRAAAATVPAAAIQPVRLRISRLLRMWPPAGVRAVHSPLRAGGPSGSGRSGAIEAFDVPLDEPGRPVAVAGPDGGQHVAVLPAQPPGRRRPVAG